jgi:rRNA maturation endonuclease Nob1
MPEYRCEKCGIAHYGWSKSDICTLCGGKLKPTEKANGNDSKDVHREAEDLHH